jgi:hypothetical protein
VCLCLALTASASAAPTWLPPTDIAGPTASITFPEIAVNARGDAIAIWPRDIGSGETILETLERPAGGDWSQPVVLSDPGEEHPTAPRIALDTAGNAVAVWSVDLGSAIRTAARPAGGDWSDPEDLSIENGRTPELAMNAAGDAVAVWTGFDGVDDEVTWAAVRPAGGDWSTPEELSVAGENDGFNPRVAIDAAGNAIAVWQRFDLPDDAVQAAVRPAGGEWSAPDTVSDAGEDARSPRIAMNAAGNAVAAWSPLGGGIRTATRPFGGDWSAPEDVSAAGGTPALAIDSSGNAFALWQGAGSAEQVLWVAMRPKSGSWQAPDELSAEAQAFQSYDLAASAAAGIVATWTRSVSSTSHEVQAAIHPPGGSWSAPEEISTPGENSGLPELGFDAAGNAIAIWGREAASTEYFLQGSGYDFSGPQLNGLQIPATGAAGEPVSFAVSPFDVFSLGATTWTFGDGSPVATGNAVSHVYATPGKFPVTVSAAGGSGNVSTQTATISITDVVPPAPPQLLDTDPASPNVSGTPRIHGNAEAGSTVRLYAGTTCAGQPVATVSAAKLASPGISVAVAEGVTAAYSATATDASANTSACSAAISYMRLRPTGRPPSPKCIVPELIGKKLRPAKRKIRAAGCAVGKVTKPKARKGKKRGPLVVKSSRPSTGKSLPVGSQVDLRLGPKPRKTPR